MNDNHRIIVVGAGASGMAAAIAASVSGAHVCLLEALPKPGRKVMASGNGRCNFANADLSPERYNAPAFVAAAMGDEPLDPVLEFFGQLGLWYRSDDEGRLYPRSKAAASVLDVLLHALDEYGVDLSLDSRVVRVGLAPRSKPAWQVELADGTRVTGDALVWAAGGSTAGLLAQDLKVPCVEERPALCPLACSPKPPKSLDGVRVNCAVELRDRSALVTRQEGEVLFRPYGVSGIVIFDLSRLAYSGDELVLDLLPDIATHELRELLDRRAKQMRSRIETAQGRLAFLDGALHPKVGRFVMESVCGREGRRSVDVGAVVDLLKHWRFEVVGPADTAHAQITQGGVDLCAVDPLTMAVKDRPGLYVCGEALDVDGECGGLNLAWAWSSGQVAGVSAARYTRTS